MYTIMRKNVHKNFNILGSQQQQQHDKVYTSAG